MRWHLHALIHIIEAQVGWVASRECIVHGWGVTSSWGQVTRTCWRILFLAHHLRRIKSGVALLERGPQRQYSLECLSKLSFLDRHRFAYHDFLRYLLRFINLRLRWCLADCPLGLTMQLLNDRRWFWNDAQGCIWLGLRRISTAAILLYESNWTSLGVTTGIRPATPATILEMQPGLLIPVGKIEQVACFMWLLATSLVEDCNGSFGTSDWLNVNLATLFLFLEENCLWLRLLDCSLNFRILFYHDLWDSLMGTFNIYDVRADILVASKAEKTSFNLLR